MRISHKMKQQPHTQSISFALQSWCRLVNKESQVAYRWLPCWIFYDRSVLCVCTAADGNLWKWKKFKYLLNSLYTHRRIRWRHRGVSFCGNLKLATCCSIKSVRRRKNMFLLLKLRKWCTPSYFCSTFPLFVIVGEWHCLGVGVEVGGIINELDYNMLEWCFNFIKYAVTHHSTQR